MTFPNNSEPDAPRFTVPLWMWAAAAAVILFFAMTHWQAQKLQRQLAELQLQMSLEKGRKESLEAQRQEMDQIRALLAAPETREVLLKPISAEKPLIKILWNEEIGLLLMAQNVPATPAGRVLQFWVVPKKGNAISGGTLQPGANGSVLRMMRPAKPIRIKDALALTITIEPAPGSRQPTSMPAWAVTIH